MLETHTNHHSKLASDSKGKAAIFLAGLVVGCVLAIGVTSVMRHSSLDRAEANSGAAQISGKKASKATSSGSPYEGITPEQAAANLRGVLSSSASLEDMNRLRGLIDQAATFDASGSFDAALEMIDPAKRRDVMRRVLSTWILTDREGAIAAIDQVGNLALRRDLLKYAVGTLSHRNPQGAIAVLKETPALRNNDMWRESFANLAKSDPTAAIAAWDTLDHPDERNDALRGLAESFANKDLAAAVDWAKGLSGKEDTTRAILEVLRSGADSDPVLAATHIGLLKGIDDEKAQNVAASIAEKWAETNLTAAVEWSEKLPANQRDEALREIASDVMRYDPDQAQELVAKIEDQNQRGQVIQQLARLHMTAGAEETAKWINELPAQDRASAWRGAASEWARTRPEEAAVFAMSEDLDPSARKQLIDQAAPAWARIDPAGAADWAATVPGKEGKDAVARVVEEWSRRDPAAAIAFVSASFAGDQVQEMTRRAVGSWTREDPAQAASFVSGLEESKIKDVVYRDVTERWMREDSMAASEWVGSLAPSPARDSAVSTLINRIERDDPEAAVRWAETISNPRSREETYKRLIRRLQKDS